MSAGQISARLKRKVTLCLLVMMPTMQPQTGTKREEAPVTLGGEQGPVEEPLEEMTAETAITTGIVGTSLTHSQDEVTVHVVEEGIKELD